MEQIKDRTEPHWKYIYISGGVAALVMFIITLCQVVIFAIWQPPTTAEEYFNLFQRNWLLGLLDLDLLYIANNTLLILFYLALYASLRKTAEASTLIALVLGIVGIAAYYASNTAFEMLSLSHQYTAAVGAEQKTFFLAAGEAMLAIYKGTAFDVYYIFNAIALLIFSVVMLKSRVFTRATACWGRAAGIFMTIPSTAGTIGLDFSLVSLFPWKIFSVKVALQLLRSPVYQ